MNNAFDVITVAAEFIKTFLEISHQEEPEDMFQ